MPGQVPISHQKAKEIMQKRFRLHVVCWQQHVVVLQWEKLEWQKQQKEHGCASPCIVSGQKPTIHLREIFWTPLAFFSFPFTPFFHIRLERESATNEIDQVCRNVHGGRQGYFLPALWEHFWLLVLDAQKNNNPCSLNVVLVAAFLRHDISLALSLYLSLIAFLYRNKMYCSLCPNSGNRQTNIYYRYIDGWIGRSEPFISPHGQRRQWRNIRANIAHHVCTCVRPTLHSNQLSIELYIFNKKANEQGKARLARMVLSGWAWQDACTSLHRMVQISCLITILSPRMTPMTAHSHHHS